MSTSLPNVYYTHRRTSSAFPTIVFFLAISALCGVTYWQSRLIADIPKPAAGNSGERESLTAIRQECLDLQKSIQKEIWQLEDVADGFEQSVAIHEKAWKERHDPKERYMAEDAKNQLHNLQIGLMGHTHTKERLDSIVNRIEERMGEIR